MLTNKNRAIQASSTLWTALLLLLFTGCQPSGPKALLLGDKYVRQGEYPKALKYLARATLFLPEKPQVWNLQGLAYHGLRQPPRAAEAYQRALRIDRNFAPAHFNLGVLLLQENRPVEAAHELQAYVALSPNDARGWSRLGAALARLKRTDEAERALSQALKLDPKNADAHNSMGIVLIQRKRPSEAIAAFNEALRTQPGFPAALLNQGIVAQEFYDNNKVAVDRYRAFLASKPEQNAGAAVRRLVHEIESGAIDAPPPIALADLTTNTGIGAKLRSNLAQQAEQTRPAPEPQPTKTNTLVAKLSPPATNAVAAVTEPVVKTNIPPAATPMNLVSALPPPPAVKEPEVSGVQPAALVAAPKTNAFSTNTIAEQAPPVQVVQVQEPELHPATEDVEPEVEEPAPKLALIEERPLLAPRKRNDEEKRGLMARLNPTHWFDREEPKTVPLPSARPPVVPERAAAAPQPTRIPPPPGPRYEYHRQEVSGKTDRATAQRLFARAVSAQQQRQLGEAINLYRQALAADPSYFEASYNLGLAAYRNKDLPLALAANERAVALRPSSVDARYNFALTLREAGYYADAANELRTLVTQAPNEARAQLALANVYAQQLDEPVLARTHYQKFLELAPNHADAPAVRQWLMSSR